MGFFLRRLSALLFIIGVSAACDITYCPDGGASGTSTVPMVFDVTAGSFKEFICDNAETIVFVAGMVGEFSRMVQLVTRGKLTISTVIVYLASSVVDDLIEKLTLQLLGVWCGSCQMETKHIVEGHSGSVSCTCGAASTWQLAGVPN